MDLTAAIPRSFNKGNDPDRPPPTFPLDAVPDYPNQFHSPQPVSELDPMTPDPEITLADLFEVTATVKQVMLRQWPEDYAKTHRLGEDLSPILHNAGVADSYDLARLVHMDKPTDLFYIVDAWVKDQAGLDAHVATNSLDCFPFLELIINDVATVTQLIDMGLNQAFEEKWYWGIARPEEVAGYNLTLYAEGCPNHGSYPAGHGTVAGVVAEYILRSWDLKRAQRDEVELACRQFAHGRTFAGVHYAADNEEGYNLGRKVVTNFFEAEPVLPDPVVVKEVARGQRRRVDAKG